MTDVRLEHRQLLQQLFSLLLFLYIYARDKLRRLSTSYVVVKIDEIILLIIHLFMLPILSRPCRCTNYLLTYLLT